ncbi:hypothetical protein D3C71_2011690 [compost metagenome]
MLWMSKYLQNASLLDNPSLLHDRHLVANLLNDRHFMRDDHDGDVVFGIDFLQQL